jgi:hypothetical protein
MRFGAVSASLVLFSPFLAGPKRPDGKSARPSSWVYVAKGPAVVFKKPSTGKAHLAELARGTLVELLETKESESQKWARVRFVEPSFLKSITGWIGFDRIETLPLDRLPGDGELLKLLGGPYLEDAVSADSAIARYWVRQAGQDSALVCFIASRFLPQARLQVFERAGEKFSLGPFLEFLPSDLSSGIAKIEVQDLVGDGNECLITREAFRLSPGNAGVNLVIRRLEGNRLRVLWKAPIEQRNFAFFPPSVTVLAPPEKNVGAPGTLTQGSVEFRSQGHLSQPVWRGKIEFHIPGREAPVETLTIDKVCPWTGTAFVPFN